MTDLERKARRELESVIRRALKDLATPGVDIATAARRVAQTATLIAADLEAARASGPSAIGEAFERAEVTATT